jgi:hypothetical protein
MPRWLIAATVLLIALTYPLAGSAQEPEPTPAGSFPIPVLGERTGYSILPYLQEEALIMHRSSGGFDAGAMNWAAGPRFVLGLPFADNNAIEFAYMGIYGMDASASAAAPVTISANGAGTNAVATYHSFMQSGELNIRHFFTPEFSLLAGFRYVNWHENLGSSFDPVDPFAGVVFPPGAITHDFHTSNNLYGFQLGGDWKTNVMDRCGIELFGKAGVFGNRSEMNVDVNTPSFGPLTTHGAATDAAFVGETGLIGTYKLTDWLKIRAGYQVMWLEGLALSPAQIDIAKFPGPSPINNRGGVFLHGAVIGIDYRW